MTNFYGLALCIGGMMVRPTQRAHTLVIQSACGRPVLRIASDMRSIKGQLRR
jgi:hypothetical protein